MLNATPTSIHPNGKTDKITLAINTSYQGKPPQALLDDNDFWRGYNGAFKRYRASPADLATAIRSGYAISAVVNGYRKRSNFVSAQHIGLDLDAGTDECRIPSLQRDPFVVEFGAIIHPTSSSTDEHPRSRVIIILSEPVTDPVEYSRMVEEIHHRRDLPVDTKCKDPARLFFGSVGCEPTILNNGENRLPVDLLRQWIAETDQERPQQRQFCTRVQNSTDPDAMTRSAENYLQRAISGNPSGGGRNDDGLWLACQLRDLGLSVSSAESYMLNYQGAVGHAGDHPYTESEARASLKSAYSKSQRDPAIFGRGKPSTSANTIYQNIPSEQSAPVTRFPGGMPYTITKRGMNLHKKASVKSQHPAIMVWTLYQELGDYLPDGVWFSRGDMQKAMVAAGYGEATRETLDTALNQLVELASVESCVFLALPTAGNTVGTPKNTQVCSLARKTGDTRLYRFPDWQTQIAAFERHYDYILHEWSYGETPVNAQPEFGDNLPPDDLQRLDDASADLYERHAEDRTKAEDRYQDHRDKLNSAIKRIEAGRYWPVELEPGEVRTTKQFRAAYARAVVKLKGGELGEGYRLQYEVGVSRAALPTLRDNAGMITVEQTRTKPAAKLTDYERDYLLMGMDGNTAIIKAPYALKFADDASEAEQNAYDHRRQQQREKASKRRDIEPVRKPKPAPQFVPDVDLLPDVLYPDYSERWKLYQAAIRKPDHIRLDIDGERVINMHTGETYDYTPGGLWQAIADDLKPAAVPQQEISTQEGETMPASHYTMPREREGWSESDLPCTAAAPEDRTASAPANQGDPSLLISDSETPADQGDPHYVLNAVTPANQGNPRPLENSPKAEIYDAAMTGIPDICQNSDKSSNGDTGKIPSMPLDPSVKSREGRSSNGDTGKIPSMPESGQVQTFELWSYELTPAAPAGSRCECCDQPAAHQLSDGNYCADHAALDFPARCAAYTAYHAAPAAPRYVWADSEAAR